MPLTRVTKRNGLCLGAVGEDLGDVFVDCDDATVVEGEGGTFFRPMFTIFG